jgi:hypothetical protein
VPTKAVYMQRVTASDVETVGTCPPYLGQTGSSDTRKFEEKVARGLGYPCDRRILYMLVKYLMEDRY